MNSIVIVIGTVKMKFILTFLCCKKIIHIFFDLYEGVGKNLKLLILPPLEMITFLITKLSIRK